MEYNTPLCIRVPQQVKANYVNKPEWAKSLRKLLQNTAVKAYENDVHGVPDDLVALREETAKVEAEFEQARQIAMDAEIRLSMLLDKAKAREDQVRVEAERDREVRAKEHRVDKALRSYGLNSRLSGKEYARKLKANGNHIANPEAVLKALKVEFGVELTPDELVEYVRRGSEEAED